MSVSRTGRACSAKSPIPVSFCGTDTSCVSRGTCAHKLSVRRCSTRLQYKVWVGSHPEPAWGDPSYGDTVTVPTDFVYAGQTGWYLGHIPPGGKATMTHLATWSGQASSP